MIRGPLKSRSMKSVLEELSDLRAGGVAEAVLIAQDTTRYGEDMGRRAIAELVDEAADIMQGGWLRLLYCYPDGVTDALIDVMMRRGNVCRYMDIPMQHFSDDVLRRMNRRQTKDDSVRLVHRLHDAGFVLRTSLIVGFPGETSRDFDTLLACVEDLRFDRLGVFRYSVEEGTPAAAMSGQVPDDIKMQRYEQVMALQEGISQQICSEYLGQKLRVIVDGIDDETGMTVGRTMGQAPQIDGMTYISRPAHDITDANAKKPLTPGAFHDVLIKDAYEYDLLGEIE
jgi:ribosomal protein S12 methylthiotransferase